MGSASYDDLLRILTRPDREVLFELGGPEGNYLPRLADQAEQSSSIVGPTMGAPLHNSVRFMADVEGPAEMVRLEVSTDVTFLGRDRFHMVGIPEHTAASVTASDEYKTVTFDVTGLTPRTTYWARWWIGGKPVGEVMKFRTLAAPGAPAGVRIGFGSCILFGRPTTRIPMLERAATKNLDLMMIMGDEDYSDINRNDIFAFRAANWRKLRRNASFQMLAKVCPMASVESDHSLIGDDKHWDSDYSARGTTFQEIVATSRQVLRETFPYYDFVQVTLGESNAEKIILTQKFDTGLSRFWLLDDQSQRRWSGIGTADKTFLGNGVQPPDRWNQKGWFTDELAAADGDGIKLGFPVIETGWLNAYADGFPQRAPAEQTDLCNAMRDTVQNAMLAILSGDVHSILFDDGGNADKSTGGGMAVPIAVSSPILRDAALSGAGPATWLGTSAIFREAQAMVFLEIAEDNLSWTMTAEAYDPEDDEFVELGTFSSTDAVPAIQFSQDSISGAAGTTVQVPVERTWFGPVGGVAATITKSSGGTIPLAIGANRKKLTIPFVVPASAVTLMLSAPVRGVLGARTSITVTPTA
ncbi:hypothetical protein ACIKTA_12630 [Hansschlegelia beijingensis]